MALDDLFNFVGSLSSSIQMAFRSVQKFFMGVELVFLNITFIFVVILFFLVVSLFIIVPVKVYPYFTQIKAFFHKFFDKKRR